jgi:hypothetical protein
MQNRQLRASLVNHFPKDIFFEQGQQAAMAGRKIAPEHPDKAVHVLSGLLNSPHANRWTYTAHRQAIRTVLENGLAAGTAATVACVRELISFLSAIAETSYLDLVRPTTEPSG